MDERRWRTEERCSRPVLVALYLRDALGIVDPSGLPRLAGTGLGTPEPAPDQLLGWAWTRLWASVIEPDSRLDGSPGELPVFDAALRRHLDDARAYAEVVSEQHVLGGIERYEQSLRRREVLAELVREREEHTGSTGTFELRIESLPLVSPGAWWLAEQTIAVDARTGEDPDAYRAALAPIIERLV